MAEPRGDVGAWGWERKKVSGKRRVLEATATWAQNWAMDIGSPGHQKGKTGQAGASWRKKENRTRSRSRHFWAELRAVGSQSSRKNTWPGRGSENKGATVKHMGNVIPWRPQRAHQEVVSHTPASLPRSRGGRWTPRLVTAVSKGVSSGERDSAAFLSTRSSSSSTAVAAPKFTPESKSWEPRQWNKGYISL